MNAIVLGNGRSGKAAAKLLSCEGWNVRVVDGDDVWPRGDWRLCVTSPGVPIDHPWQKAARAAGVKVISEFQLGAERYRKAGGRMVAVTGSKGKSSVVKIVAEAVGGVPCGNYGMPLSEVVLDFAGADFEGRMPVAVVEVSSFQLETTDLPGDMFEAAAVLNLQEDHLDRHSSAETYHALKRKLLEFAPVKILGSCLKESKGAQQERRLFEGSYFDNAILADNAGCAVKLMKALGLDDDAIRSAFKSFEALPHRMQMIGVFGRVAYVDDSKATSISALIAGVKMAFSKYRVRLVAGGLPKGDDPSQARNCLSKCAEKVYLIGQGAKLFMEAWHDVVPCEICGDLKTAVKRAREEAKEGECVLLSPGTASFDQFRSYGERGDRFAEYVKSSVSVPKR